MIVRVVLSDGRSEDFATEDMAKVWGESTTQSYELVMVEDAQLAKELSERIDSLHTWQESVGLR